MAKDNHEMLLGELKSGVTHIMERLALGSKRMDKLEENHADIKRRVDCRFEELFEKRCNPCQARIANLEANQMRDKVVVAGLSAVVTIVISELVRRIL